MKLLLLFGFIFAFGIFMPYVNSLFFGGSSSGSNNLNTTLSCLATASRNCGSTVRVCGRIGTSRQCRNFANRCSLNVANCGQSTSNRFNVVANSSCTGIALNTNGRCSGSSSSSSSGSTSNVRPIIINAG